MRFRQTSCTERSFRRISTAPRRRQITRSAREPASDVIEILINAQRKHVQHVVLHYVEHRRMCAAGRLAKEVVVIEIDEKPAGQRPMCIDGAAPAGEERAGTARIIFRQLCLLGPEIVRVLD